MTQVYALMENKTDGKSAVVLMSSYSLAAVKNELVRAAEERGWTVSSNEEKADGLDEGWLEIVTRRLKVAVPEEVNDCDLITDEYELEEYDSEDLYGTEYDDEEEEEESDY